MGPAGAEGAVGATGPQGPIGLTGLQGPAGGGPAQIFLLNAGANITQWTCQDVDLQDACNNKDGCRIRMVMQLKTDTSDQLRMIDENIAMEIPSQGGGRSPGVYGWTSEGAGSYAWISGGSTIHTVASPWDWGFILTYRHSNCGGNNSILPAYQFRLMTHPQVQTRFLIYD